MIFDERQLLLCRYVINYSLNTSKIGRFVSSHCSHTDYYEQLQLMKILEIVDFVILVQFIAVLLCMRNQHIHETYSRLSKFNHQIVHY